jgi:Arc/MetJ-type ribon-helix-helix transcriptional regulator
LPEKGQDFKGVSLKRELVEEVERFIQEYRQYKSVADLVHEAVRVRMEDIRKSYEKMARFQQLNSDDNGVKIWDSKSRQLAEIQLKPNGIRCSLDDADTCEHIMFALSIPEIRALIQKRRKEGWKLPAV